MQQLVEEDDDDAGNKQLEDKDKANPGAQVRRSPVEPGHDLHNGVAKSDDQRKHCKKAKAAYAFVPR